MLVKGTEVMKNMEGQMVVDFAKRMEMAVVNSYFQKREGNRVKRRQEKTGEQQFVWTLETEKDWRLRGGDRRECSQTASDGRV